MCSIPHVTAAWCQLATGPELDSVSSVSGPLQADPESTDLIQGPRSTNKVPKSSADSAGRKGSTHSPNHERRSRARPIFPKLALPLSWPLPKTEVFHFSKLK